MAASFLDAIAQVQLSLGLFDAAEKRAEASIALRRRLYGPAAEETAASHITLARVLFEHGDTKSAQGELDAARPALAGKRRAPSPTAGTRSCRPSCGPRAGPRPPSP